jgi:hypothetical protein
MKKLMNRAGVQLSAAVTTGLMLSASPASADQQSNNFSNIASNITTSISSLPALLSGLSYMFGIMLGVLGILKIKDHVENPQQTPLKDGAIRLAAGGGLFALPIIYEAMKNTVGTGNGVEAAGLNAISFQVNSN